MCVGLFLALALSSKLVAQSSGSPEYRAMEAHQHGQAELRILLEANLVEMELESPAFNLVGFEQKASSPQEKKAVKNAVAFLESPARLIAFGGSACSPKAIQIDVSSVSNEEDEHGHEDANDHEAEHQHEDEHDHEAEHQNEDEHDHEAEHQNEGEHDHEAEHQHEDEHEEEHSHEDETETSHADIIARYSFSCENKSDLSYIEVNFFRVFPGLEKIKALWVGEKGQGTMELTPSKRRLDMN